MKLPRDLSGAELAKLLRRYGYQEIRQSGSHIRVRSTAKGPEHQVTIPAHASLKGKGFGGNRRAGALARVTEQFDQTCRAWR